ENTGYLPPSFWINLWRLWPVVLVLIGVELLLAHRVPWVVLAGFAAVVLVGGAVWVDRGTSSVTGSGGVATTTATSLDGATQSAVTVRFGAGGLNLGPILQPQPDQLASMTFQGPRQLAPESQYTVSSGGVGQLEYQSNGPRGAPAFVPFVGGRSDAAQMDLTLAPNVPITSLTVQTGAADARLDLSSLRVINLDLSIGAATTWVRFPEAAGTTTAHISGGASTLSLEVPQGVAAQIQLRGGLSTVNVDQSRFPQVSDNMYRSADYATATNKVDLTIETGVTTIQIS
ncbi:MAG: hypothetical protein JO057_08890, partial [Chloroflexi bacterium]|nr:hypothetical protein [Chloroflexota bacterium]